MTCFTAHRTSAAHSYLCLPSFAAAVLLLLTISTPWAPPKEEYARTDTELPLQSTIEGDNWDDAPSSTLSSTEGLLRRRRRRRLLSMSQLPDDTQSSHPQMPPLHMIQIGLPMTLTSYQFQLVCLSLFLKLESLASIPSPYDHPAYGMLNPQELLNRIQCRSTNPFAEFDPQTPMVIKANNPLVVQKKVVQEQKSPDDVWVFQTTSRDPSKFYKNEQRAQLAKEGYPNVMHTLDVEEFKDPANHLIVETTIIEYAQLFGLDAARAHELYKFMQSWSILKVCCGAEMSTSRRIELLPGDSPILHKIMQGRQQQQQQQSQSRQPHICSKHDIKQVERTLLAMPLYRRLKSTGGGGGRFEEIIKLSPSDGELSGDYCSSYNDMVRSCRRHSLERCIQRDGLKKTS
mmetsp:Transcript_28440/g.60048  ORF Transcript_28440/g.60048 Transcript_28440/m.60048 type:complete len:402 (-) Transcript_28440:32-1237(-)